MQFQLPTSTLLALLPFFIKANAQASGTGTTTRYWDCCKPSCAWSGKATLASGYNPVGTCDIDDNALSSSASADAVSGCNGGTSYMCSDEAPWAVSNDLAYGFAAVSIAGGSESSWCCACYELTFTSGAVAGKKMVVQATNTGGDLSSNQFDISIPGGGVGIFNGCTAEWGAPSSGWGAQYGGISSAADCATFPTALQAGCDWRFDWFEGSDNPTVSFTQVECPAAITAKSGCKRADDTSMPAEAADTASVIASSTVATVESSTSAVAATSSAEAVVESSTSAAAQAATTSAPVVEESSTSSVADAATTSAVAISTQQAVTSSLIKVASSTTSSATAATTSESSDDEYWDGTCEM